MKVGEGGAPYVAPGGIPPYRVWVIMVTAAYADDLIAHLARAGFVVAADDPTTIKGRSAAIFSCRVGVTDRLVAEQRARVDAAAAKSGKPPPTGRAHQEEAIAGIVHEVLVEQEMLFHSVIVAACEDAAWFSGNIDLGKIETYRQNDRSRLS